MSEKEFAEQLYHDLRKTFSLYLRMVRSLPYKEMGGVEVNDSYYELKIIWSGLQEAAVPSCKFKPREENKKDLGVDKK